MLKIKYLALLGLLMLLLSACGLIPAAVDSAVVNQTAVSRPVAIASSTATPESSSVTSTPTEEAIDYCESCHTDKQKLIDTADPVQEVINENKGEG